jgi:hypothetical protein
VVLVLTDRVEDPDPVTEAGLKLALAPVGNPLTVRPTLLLNPPDPVTVAEYEVLAPAVTVAEAGVAVMEKSPTTGATAPARASIRACPFGLPHPVTKS